MSARGGADRETWATRIGFILAAVGSAVGLGNIWRFPFQVGQEGGAAFLLVYLIIVLAIGFPAIMVEFVIGRRSERNPFDAFLSLGYRKWSFIGAVGILTGFIILSYYSVVAGWVLRYTVGSVTGAYFGEPGAYFQTISMGLDALAFHAIFMLAVAIIVGLGVQRGIELAVKVMVPAIVGLLIVLALYGATLDGAGAGYTYYLSPDFGYLVENAGSIVSAAAGQAFFTLSLGMGVMITYASYLGEDTNLGVDGAWIVGLNTGISILAGFVIFPVLFAVGVDPADPGPGALFVATAQAIADLPGARVIGVLFFGIVVIAALSSAISLLEVMVAFLMDHFDVGRTTATAGLSVAIFLLGVPTALDISTLELYDQITAELLLPLGMFLLVLFVGWVYDEAVDELERGIGELGTLGTAWHWHVRVVLLLVIAAVLVLSVQNLVGALA